MFLKSDTAAKECIYSVLSQPSEYACPEGGLKIQLLFILLLLLFLMQCTVISTGLDKLDLIGKGLDTASCRKHSSFGQSGDALLVKCAVTFANGWGISP